MGCFKVFKLNDEVHIKGKTGQVSKIPSIYALHGAKFVII
jgi:hypothetical protein